MDRNEDALLGRLESTGEVFVLTHGSLPEWDGEGSILLKRSGMAVLNPEGNLAMTVTGSNPGNEEAPFFEMLARQEKAWLLTSDDPEGSKEPSFNLCSVSDKR